MKSIPLGQVIRRSNRRIAGNGEYPILSMTMHEGLVNQADKFKKRIASEDTSQYRVVSRNQLVVGFPIDEGVLSFQDLYDQAIVSPAYTIWELRDQAAFDNAFLERYLRSPSALRYYRTKLRSTTARRRVLPEDLFLEMPVPLLPVFEQTRFAGILDQADLLHRKRRQAKILAEEYLRSTFFDMFGDPILNNKGWKTAPLGSITQIRRGASPRPIDQYLGGTVPWVKIGDGTKVGAEFAISKTAEHVTEEGARRSVRLKPGSVIFANCGVSLGFARVLAIEGCIHDGWLSIEEYEGHFEPIFLIYLLNATTKFFRASAPEGTQPNLNTGIMKAHLVPMPPKDCQLHFRNIVESTTSVNEKLCAAEADTFRLIAALTDFLLPGAEST